MKWVFDEMTCTVTTKEVDGHPKFTQVHEYYICKTMQSIDNLAE